MFKIITYLLLKLCLYLILSKYFKFHSYFIVTSSLISFDQKLYFIFVFLNDVFHRVIVFTVMRSIRLLILWILFLRSIIRTFFSSRPCS